MKHWADELAAGPPSPRLVLGGGLGSGRATAARAAASAAGRSAIETDWGPDPLPRIQMAAREALWSDAVLLVRLPDTVNDAELALLWQFVQPWPVPVVVLVAADSIEHAMACAPDTAAALQIDAPTITMREALWRRLLDAADASHLDAAEIAGLAERYDFVPGLVVSALRRASAERAGNHGTGVLTVAALSSACRAVGTARMGTIAQRLALPYSRDDLVVPAELAAELDLAIGWMHNRRQVFERWQFGRRIALGRGMTALFAGPPGTGKTMAAQVLAHELGLDLFRVDLSRVMSKFIGETEKNLAQLFDDATASGAVLFFDEADALFGKRSEVKDAHDRYANLEISYLLQRMEEHEGISLLATNRMGDLDDAFTRRFHFILDFPLPRAPERRRIWEGMLPREAERDDTVSLDALADEYEMSGGEIRNSVLSAAFAAAAEGVPIGLKHLKRGVRRELLKTGRVLDREQRKTLEE